MIIKKRTIPLQIPKLQALICRTPETHPKLPLVNGNLSIKKLRGFLQISSPYLASRLLHSMK
ncbi:hypothetical protein [Metabacillus sp. Hm71]|uniref:hypothetical protein n=1 Tax=Metabacillus sp. Hm71 TaxID=3450743 RepID=UPI003F42A603